jgi:alkylation response protein AidB-like acyl-CoA dehydrogenase
MNFRLDRSQVEIQKAARDFARGEFDKDLVLELDRKGAFPRKIWEKAAQLGFIGIHYDEAFSGGGLGQLENALLAEELCRKDSGLGAALMLAGYGAECLLRCGQNNLKKKFLPPVAEGEMLSAIAFYEPGNGFALSNLETTADKDGNAWVLNGQKTYVLHGDQADFFILLARTDPHAPPDNGISMFLVEAHREGLSMETLGEKLGSRMIGAWQLRLEGVRIPADNLVGKAGKGLLQAGKFFDESRVLAAAMAVGTAQGAFDRAIDYVKQREQFNRKLVQFEITRHKLADMALKVKLARLITYETAWQSDQGKLNAEGSAMAKLYASQVAVEVADEAIQLLGGYGYMAEYEIEHFYRDAKTLEIFENNKGEQKNIVAGAVIGKIKR